MKVLVLGAGAVGLSVAAKLSRVCEVHAVARKKTADAIRAGGFTLTGIWGRRHLPVQRLGHRPRGRPFDYAIVTSKSRDTDAICREFADNHQRTPRPSASRTG